MGSSNKRPTPRGGLLQLKLILSTLCTFKLSSRLVPNVSATIIVPHSKSVPIHTIVEKYESEPALFGTPFEQGVDYSAHLQVLRTDDLYLCGGVYDAMDDDVDSTTNSELSSFLQKNELDGGNLVFNDTILSLAEFQGKLVQQQNQERKKLKTNEEYDIVVPKDGLPVALLVKRGLCSFEVKARNAMKLKAPPNVLQYIIVYDDKERNALVPMSANVSRGINIGLLFCSLNSGLALMRHVLNYHYVPNDVESTIPSIINAAAGESGNRQKLAIPTSDGDKVPTSKERRTLGKAFYDEAGPIVILDSKSPNLPSIYQDPQEWVIAVMAGFMIFFSCLSCIFFCLQSGYVQVQDGVIIVGSRRPLPNGWANNNLGNDRGPTQRLLTIEEVNRLPEIEYQENGVNESAPILQRGQNNKNYSTEMKDGDNKSNSFDTHDLFDCNSCSVCLEEYVTGDKLKVLPCKHTFHTTCIVPWLTERQSTCPLCKSEVIVNEENGDDDREEEVIQDTSIVQSSDTSSPLSSSEYSSSLSSSLTPSSSVNSSFMTDQDVEEQTGGRNRRSPSENSRSSWNRWFGARDEVEEQENSRNIDDLDTSEQILNRPLLQDQ